MLKSTTIRLIAVLLALALVAAACGGDDDTAAAAATPGEVAPTAIPTPTPSGEVDNTDLTQKPLVEAPADAPTELAITDIVLGDGAEAAAGDALITHYVGVGLGSGLQFDSSWDTGRPFTFLLGDGNVIQGWDDGLAGMSVGGRRELVIPADLAFGDTGTGSGEVEPGEDVIFVVDLLGVVPSSSTKPEVTVPAEPAESVAAQPEVDVPADAEGADFSQTDLSEGDGAVAAEGDLVAVRYVGVTTTGSDVDTRWAGQPVTFTIGADETIDGLDQGVLGMAVGGRRQLVVPADMAYGDEGTDTVVPGETLVYVVELLGLLSSDVERPDPTVPDAPAEELEITDITVGDGAVATAGDTLVMQYVGEAQSTGEEFDASWERAPFAFTLGRGQVIQGWDEGIEGMAVGGRRALVIPAAQAYGEAGSGGGIGPNETLVFIVDLIAVVPNSKPVVTDLIEGDGEEAELGSTVWVHYVGVSQSTGEQFDSSWDRGIEAVFPFALGVGQVIPGWDQGLEGMRVGGRRELIIPPDLAYGDQGAGDGLIAPGETLVFVVDLIAIS